MQVSEASALDSMDTLNMVQCIRAASALLTCSEVVICNGHEAVVIKFAGQRKSVQAVITQKSICDGRR